MFKLVILSVLAVTVAAAVLPRYKPYRQYNTVPPTLPTAPILPASPPQPNYYHTPSPPYVQHPSGRFYAILRSVNEIAPDGRSYHYAYDTENGISAQESGNLVGFGPDAGTAASGSYQYTSPEGVPVQVSYVADENGFQPSGNLLSKSRLSPYSAYSPSDNKLLNYNAPY